MRKRSLFGQTLLLLRKERGLTQAQLAERINKIRGQDDCPRVSKQHIYRYENNPDITISKKNLDEMSRALEIDKPGYQWELRQIYENAGFSFNPMLSIGRGEVDISQSEILKEEDPIRQWGLRFSKSIAEGRAEEAYVQASKAWEVYQSSHDELKQKHYAEKLIGNLGTALLAIGQTESLESEVRKKALNKAIKEFKAVLDVNSKNAFFNSQLGHVYFTYANSFSQSDHWSKSEHWKQAIYYFRQSLIYFDPASDVDTTKYQETSFYLGYAYTVVGEFEEARLVLNSALFLTNELSALGLYIMACLLACEEQLAEPQDRNGQAFSFLKKSIILDKSLKAFALNEPLLQSLKKNADFKRLTRLK